MQNRLIFTTIYIDDKKSGCFIKVCSHRNIQVTIVNLLRGTAFYMPSTRGSCDQKISRFRPSVTSYQSTVFDISKLELAGLSPKNVYTKKADSWEKV